MRPRTIKIITAERPGPLTDSLRGSLLAALQQTVSTSSLIKNNKVLQDLVVQLAADYATIKPCTDAIAADEAKLSADRATLLVNRSAFDRGYNLVIDVAEHDAKTPQDLQGMSLVPYLAPPQPTVLAVPQLIDIRPPKKARGYTTVSVHETGKTRRKYAAEWSPDPIGVWTALPGTGKSRRVTGASGTKVWVRFALVRGRAQSDWSTPVLVVIP
jgi:hypothetical protein